METAPDNRTQQMSNYITSKPFKGKIEVIGKNGRVICTIDIADFKSKKKAVKMADEIAVLLHIHDKKRTNI